MRVFLVTSKLNFETAGGAVYDLHLKARGLAEREHNVTVVTAFSYANKISIPLPYRVREEFVVSRGLIGIQRGVFRILKKYGKEADVFYVDGHMFLYGAGLYRFRSGSKPVLAFFNVKLNSWVPKKTVTALGWILEHAKQNIRKLIERIFGVPLANRIDSFAFNAPTVEALYHRFGIANKKPCVILPDYVDAAAIMQDVGWTPKTLADHHRLKKPVTFFSGGRMIPEKGFDLLLRAFARIPNKEQYRLIITGGGPVEKDLHALSHELGLDGLVSFPGWVKKSEVSSFMRQAHVFILPRWILEYASAVVSEAMAHGIPCIVTAGGGVEWLTKGGALTFPENDVTALAGRMQELAENDALRIRFAKANLKKAEDLSYQKLTLLLERSLSEIVKNRKMNFFR